MRNDSARGRVPASVGAGRSGTRSVPGAGATRSRPGGSPAAERGRPLGTPTKKCSGVVLQGLTPLGPETRGQARRAERYRLREALADFSHVPRLVACGRRRVPGPGEPQVKRQEPEGGARAVAHWSRLQLCGRVWTCPVCSPRIRQARAAELDRACAWWMDGKGGADHAAGEHGPRWVVEPHGVGSVCLVTLTFPHAWGDRLASLWRTLRGYWRALLSGRAWVETRDRFDVRHWVRAYDLTTGAASWHPHVHAVFFTGRRLDDAEVQALGDALHRRAVTWFRGQGMKPPSRAHGVQVERARTRADVARYVCQVIGEDVAEGTAWGLAQEAVRSDLKRSHHAGQRSPWQLLEDAARPFVGVTPADVDAARALWREYERDTAGAQAVRWSDGWRRLLGWDEQRTADAEAEGDAETVGLEVGGAVVYECDRGRQEWRALVATRSARAVALRLAEDAPDLDAARVAVAAYVAAVAERWAAREARRRELAARERRRWRVRLPDAPARPPRRVRAPSPEDQARAVLRAYVERRTAAERAAVTAPDDAPARAYPGGSRGGSAPPLGGTSPPVPVGLPAAV